MIQTALAITLLSQVNPGKLIQGVKAVALAPGPTGSKFVAALEDGTIRLYDAATRATIKNLGKHPQPAYALTWSPDGAWVASGDESARIFVWDTRTGQKVREFRTHTKGIQSLCFNVSRSLLLSTGKDDVVKVYNMSTSKSVDTPGKGANFYGARFMGKTNDWGVGTLGIGCRLYSSTGKVKGFLTGHDNQGVFDLDFNKSITRAVSGGKDGSAILWDVRTMKKLNSLRGHSDWVVHCQFSQNGKWVATSSSDRTVRVWDVNTFRQIALLENQCSIGSPLSFTPDGKYLVTVNIDDTIQINSLVPPQPSAPEPAAKGVKKKKKRG